MTEHERYQAGMKKAETYRAFDRQTYAVQVVLELANNRPYPDHTSYKLTRDWNNTAREAKVALEIANAVRLAMWP